MAYDEDLANRIREVVAGAPAVTEKRMFGGLAFLVNGNLAVSASGRGGILLRVDPAESAALVGNAHAERAVMGGRVMDGWLRVDVDALPDDEVDGWIARGLTYAATLPAR